MVRYNPKAKLDRSQVTTYTPPRGRFERNEERARIAAIQKRYQERQKKRNG